MNCSNHGRRGVVRNRIPPSELNGLCPLRSGAGVVVNEFDARDVQTAAAIVIDRKGYIVGWNDGAEAVLGFRPREVIGRACHHVLCGRDPEGRLVCHPWCVLSPADDREDPDDDIVLYPRSADRNVVRVTLNVFRVDGDEATRGWVVHLITSAEPLPAVPPVPWYADPAWVPRRRAFVRPITPRSDAKKPKPPETDQH